MGRQIDWARVAKAYAAQTAGHQARPMVVPRALPAALSRDPCARCGVAGTRGCEHQAPYIDEAAPADPYEGYIGARHHHTVARYPGKYR